MRKFQYLLITLAALLLLTGCTTFQAKEAGRSVAALPGELVGRALEDALDGHRQEDKERRTYYACFPPCVSTSDRSGRRAARELEEKARRKQEREVRHYEEEANSIIDTLDEAERRSGQLQPGRALTDYEQQEEERLRRRDETLENWAEFDEFMQSLEIAEEKNNDPRLSKITGE